MSRISVEEDLGCVDGTVGDDNPVAIATALAAAAQRSRGRHCVDSGGRIRRR